MGFLDDKKGGGGCRMSDSKDVRNRFTYTRSKKQSISPSEDTTIKGGRPGGKADREGGDTSAANTRRRDPNLAGCGRFQGGTRLLNKKGEN